LADPTTGATPPDPSPEPSLAPVLLRLVPVILALFPLNAAMLIVAPLWGGVARDLGLSEVMAGIITACTPLLWMISGPLAGRLADRVGRRPLLIGGVLLAFVAQGGFSVALGAGLFDALPLTGVIVGLAASRMLLGVAGGTVTVTSFALAADLTTPRQRTAITAALGGIVGLGALGGPALAAATSALGVLPVLVAMAALPLLGLPALPWTPRGRPGTRGASPPLGWLDRRVLTLGAVILTVNLAMGTADLLLGFVMTDLTGEPLEVSGPLAGGALLTAGLAVVLVQVVLTRLTLGPRALLVSGPLLAGFSFATVGLVDSVTSVFILCGVAGLGVGLSMTGWMSGMSLAVEEEEQGRAAGRVQALTSLAYVLGPLLGGAAYALDPTLPWLVLAPLLVGVGLIAGVSPSVRRADARGRQ